MKAIFSSTANVVNNSFYNWNNLGNHLLGTQKIHLSLISVDKSVFYSEHCSLFSYHLLIVLIWKLLLGFFYFWGIECFEIPSRLALVSLCTKCDYSNTQFLCRKEESFMLANSMLPASRSSLVRWTLLWCSFPRNSLFLEVSPV